MTHTQKSFKNMVLIKTNLVPTNEKRKVRLKRVKKMNKKIMMRTFKKLMKK